MEKMTKPVSPEVLNEIVGRFCEAGHDLREAGVEYDLQLVILNHPQEPSILCSSTDDIYQRQSLQVAYLDEGGQRLIEHKQFTYPKDAHLNPNMARIIKHSVDVNYVQPDGSEGEDEVVADYFSQITNVFIY